MTEKERQLLLQDLYARLPYGVKILHQGWNYEWDQELSTVEKVTGIDERFIYTKVIDNNGEEYTSDKHTISLFEDKPYLFPLSSMTEEQRKEISKRYNYHNHYGLCIEITNHSEGYWDDDNSCHLQDYLWLIDWYNKNHFDYRGLIPKQLAKDATGLNIY